MSQRTVLVADTDSKNLGRLTEVLKEKSYTTLPASNAEQALELGNQLPDIAVIDIDLEGDLNGVAAAHQLAERHGLHSLLLVPVLEQSLIDIPVANGPLGYLLRSSNSDQIAFQIGSAIKCSVELKRLHASETSLADAVVRNRQISVSIGIYMERFNTSERDAFEALRSYARSERRKLVDIAKDLIQVTEGKNNLINRINHNRAKSRSI